MRQSVKAVLALLFVVAISLTGCGGGSGSGSADGGTPTAGTPFVGKGAIEKFGSITVNGVKFETMGAKLFLPDDTVNPERVLQLETEIVDNKLLKLGMVVTVKGVLDDNGVTGKATEIEFRDTLKAKIDDGGVDLVNNTITVMGHKIALDDKIKPLLASLKPGDVVQISGLPDDKGGLRATFIEKKELAEIEHLTEFEMKGFVSSITGNTAILKLDPAAATGVTVTFPVGTVLKDGAFIEVKVPKNFTFTPGVAIICNEAPHEEDIKLNPTPTGVQVSIEGFPSSSNVSAFMLNGQSVVTNAQTVFVGGTAAEFNITKKIQAEGVIANSVLTATKIVFKALPVLANPGISTGHIEALGSITVNGVKFNTTGAVLHLRDDKTTSDRILQTETEIQDNNLLKPGMVVTVKGGFDDNGTTGTAREIEFRNTLEGTIDDKGVDFITVMGQKIIVDDPAKLIGLKAGDKVGLSGLPDDRGQIRATHIEVKDLAEFEAKGFITGLTGTTFTLKLDKNAASGMAVTLGSGVALPAGAVEGSLVEVRTLTANGGNVTATKIELENELEAAENEKKEFEGFVASGGTTDDFTVKGQRVQTALTTVFVGGIKADLVAGMKVEAEGKIVNGILIATKVMFNDNIRIDAIMRGAVNAATATTQANLTLLGKKVIITSATLMTSVADGQEVQIRGFMAANGDIIANRVDVKDTAPDPLKFRPFLQGPATITGGAMTILGTPIVTNSSSQFRVSTDLPAAQFSTSADFFAKVKSGVTVVKVKWDPLATDGAIATQPVKEAEIQLGSK